jgi:hypothetical protein
MAPSRAASARSRASTTVDDATLDDLARATIGDLDRCASTRARHVGVGVDALCGGECPRHDDEDQHPRFRLCRASDASTRDRTSSTRIAAEETI